MTHRSEHACESAIYWNESASLINEKCNFEYYHGLTPELRVLDAGDLPLAGLPVPWTFFCTKERQIPNPTEGIPYIVIKDHNYFTLNKCRTILPSRECSFM